MANREACELYIEQEVESGLEDGKTPYAIGKELSDWVAKLFEVRIKPDTIKKRAQRHKEKLGTNVPNEKLEKKTETSDNLKKLEKPTEFKHGGKREGAGRPAKPTTPEIENDKTQDIVKDDQNKNQPDQKTIWRNVENILDNLTKYMKENCETPADISDHAKKKIKRHIGLLKIYYDQI